MTAEQKLFPRAMSLAVHELRTPVTVVAGYLRMLLREQGGPLTEKQRKMLEEAERSCNRIGALVAEMSELGKLEGGDLAFARQEFDFAALLAELASAMHEGEDRGVRLVVRGIDRPVLVICQGGFRSLRAAQFLKQCGFPDVASVQGGTEAWRTAGGELIQESAQAPRPGIVETEWTHAGGENYSI